jgi:hypothetical protein
VAQGPESSASRYRAITLSLESDAFGPSSKLTGRSRSARAASQYVFPTTATPLGIGTTSTTPGRRSAGSLSNVLTWPPNTGLCFTAAYSIPGTRTSMPKTAVPLSFAGISTRGSGRPRSVQSFCAFRAGFSGGDSRAAASASSPNVRARALGRCRTLPFSVWHSRRSTPQRFDAAASSISRAEAPIWSRRSKNEDVLSLLPVNIQLRRGLR